MDGAAPPATEEEQLSERRRGIGRDWVRIPTSPILTARVGGGGQRPSRVLRGCDPAAVPVKPMWPANTVTRTVMGVDRRRALPVAGRISERFRSMHLAESPTAREVFDERDADG